MSDRVPPHDIQAEAVVLGSILMDASVLPAVRTVLSSADFFRPAHQSIFTAAAYVAEHPEKWGSLDLVTFKAALESRGALLRVTEKGTAAAAMEYVVDLVNGVPDAGNAVYYAKIVRDKARLRRFIVSAGSLTEEAYGVNGECDAFMVRAAGQMGDVLRLPVDTSEAPATGVERGIEETIDGKRKSAPMPFSFLARSAKPAAPGCVTVLCGDPGSNKSFWVLQCMIYWAEKGIPAAMLPLEKNRQYSLSRAMAQLSRNSGMTNDEWVSSHAVESREAFATHKAEIERLGTMIGETSGIVDLEWVGQWISARAEAGARIIAVDPITAADSGPKPWEGDRAFVMRCQEIATRHGCSIILVTHPRMTKGQKPTLETMAGGLAYARFPDVVLWLANHDPPEWGTVNMAMGPAELEYTNSISLFKTRDSAGRGMHIAYTFDKASLTMTEHGWITKEKRK